MADRHGLTTCTRIAAISTRRGQLKMCCARAFGACYQKYGNGMPKEVYRGSPTYCFVATKTTLDVILSFVKYVCE